MYKFLATAILGLGLAAAVSWAENSPAPTVGQGYGVQVPMTWTYETSLDRSYLNEPDIVAVRCPDITEFDQLLWSPDGKRLFFSDHRNIFSVSAEGGTPRLEYESVWIEPYQGKRYVLTPAIWNMVGISPDGNTLFFNSDDWSNAEILVSTAEDGSWGGGAKGGVSCLKSLDLATGRVQTVIGNAGGETMSRSTRYIGYFDIADQCRKIMDRSTGETWSNDTPLNASCCFSSDETHILYSPYESPARFFRVPIRGGEPEEAGSCPEVWGCPKPLDCSPMGDYVIASCWTGEKYADSNDHFSYTKMVRKCILIDTIHGTASAVLPFSQTIDADCVRFSPDGKRFCYIHNDFNQFGNHQRTLYIKDISLDLTGTDEQLSVSDDAPAGFALTGNYPNPFNPSTHLSFTLPASGTVRFTVYDVTGRTVRNLVSSPLSAGAHEMVWDGRDDSGQAVSSGTYIARLKMGSFTAAHRMTLMK
jgi:hypothetical protein